MRYGCSYEHNRKHLPKLEISITSAIKLQRFHKEVVMNTETSDRWQIAAEILNLKGVNKL
jgi:hypothetical protein